MRILAVADDRAGTQAQAVGLAQGLAEALAERLGEANPHTLITARAGTRPFARGVPFAHGMEQPPDIAVGCGRAAQAELVAMRSKGTRTVYVQDPRRGYARFDLVVAPAHDRVEAPNAVSMIGAPGRLTPARLAAARETWAELAALPSPRVAVLIGGPSRRHRFTPGIMAAHAGALAKVLAQGGALMLSLSRRSPPELGARLAALAERHPGRVRLYRGEGANPYAGFLAHADAVLVTEDSANMLTEACATGMPVFRLPMAGEAGKLAWLYAELETRCHVEPFAGRLEGMPYVPLEETKRVAKHIGRQLGLDG